MFHLLISLTFILSAAGEAALSKAEQSALDEYMAGKRKPTLSAVNSKDLVASAAERLDRLELRVFPVSVQIGRAVTSLNQRGEEVSARLREMAGDKNKANLYDDLEWLTGARKEIRKFCCQLRSDRTLQNQMQAKIFGAPPAAKDSGAKGKATYYQRLGNGAGRLNKAVPQADGGAVEIETKAKASENSRGTGLGRNRSRRGNGQGGGLVPGRNRRPQ